SARRGSGHARRPRRGCGRGPLLSDDGTGWLGTAALVRAPDADAARSCLTPDRYADIEVHDWQFGGRPS
ncbi:hypothetical protein ACWEDZ_39145, partial [Streptomyces sp. NPDC005047]